MIDAHTHLDVRSFEDLEKMALAGIEKVITCAHNPYRMSVPEVYLDHWDRLLEVETKRGEMSGLDVKVTVGIHPMGYPREWGRLIEEMPNYLEDRRVVGIGETGLHYLNREEKNLLKEQLKLGMEYSKPVVIHTPERNKEKALEEILKILREVEIEEDLVMIDHLNRDTVDLIDMEVYVGLTVQPMKISPEEAVEIIERYNKRFILSSDLGSLKSDIYA
ncbi:MAG TPA: deoxyribonuclease, partial [Methanothermococcus okinawensis]|nr:deoxyribonuclease [Methanothermococcus okinawensis]